MSYCDACEKLRNDNPSFMRNGRIGEKECESLGVNTGLNPDLPVLHDNCEDLNAINECLIGFLMSMIKSYDPCDPQKLISDLLKNQYAMNKALICSDCGQWVILESLMQEEYVTIVKTYKHTVPIEKFVNTGNIDNVMYWSGSPEGGESYIAIPVGEMDIVDTVVAQPMVVGGKAHSVTVAVQDTITLGDVHHVNFDTYEIQGIPAPGSFPFAVPIEFIVVGRKKIR